MNEETKKEIEEQFVDAQIRALEILKTKRAEVSISGSMAKLRIFVAQNHIKRAVRYTIKFPSIHAAETFAQRIVQKYPSKVEPDPQIKMF